MPSRFARAPLVPGLAVALILVLGCGRRIGEQPERDGGALGAAAIPARPMASAPSTDGWNTAQIDWQPYEAGLRQARDQKKPVCLVLSTTWCPHCKNYSHVFEDPRVVRQSRDFVMVHLDQDKEEPVAAKYAVDGSYIPRTFFLAPDGKIDDSIHPQRDRSRYFYDERDPGQLLAGMETAHRKLVN